MGEIEGKIAVFLISIAGIWVLYFLNEVCDLLGKIRIELEVIRSLLRRRDETG